MKTEANTTTDRIQTTVGELVEIITDLALQAGKSETEGYRLASMTVEKILNERRRSALCVSTHLLN